MQFPKKKSQASLKLSAIKSHTLFIHILLMGKQKYWIEFWRSLAAAFASPRTIIWSRLSSRRFFTMMKTEKKGSERKKVIFNLWLEGKILSNIQPLWRLSPYSRLNANYSHLINQRGLSHDEWNDFLFIIYVPLVTSLSPLMSIKNHVIDSLMKWLELMAKLKRHSVIFHPLKLCKMRELFELSPLNCDFPLSSSVSINTFTINKS